MRKSRKIKSVGSGVRADPGYKKVTKPKYVLSEMLKKITKYNVHKEVDWGEPCGREIIDDDEPNGKERLLNSGQ